MRVKLSKEFLKQYKKIDIRIQKAFDQRLKVFLKNPRDLSMNNHKLRDKYIGCRSIDVTADYRAIYEEVQEGEEIIAYFIAIGTHKQLYRQ
mgnify:CR=1 FL=1